MGGSAHNGKKLIPDISDQVNTIVEEYEDTPGAGIKTTYVAVAAPGALPTANDWSARKIVEDTTQAADLVTTVTWAEAVILSDTNPQATEKFVHKANNLAGLTYS